MDDLPLIGLEKSINHVPNRRKKSWIPTIYWKKQKGLVF